MQRKVIAILERGLAYTEKQLYDAGYRNPRLICEDENCKTYLFDIGEGIGSRRRGFNKGKDGWRMA